MRKTLQTVRRALRRALLHSTTATATAATTATRTGRTRTATFPDQSSAEEAATIGHHSEHHSRLAATHAQAERLAQPVQQTMQILFATSISVLVSASAIAILLLTVLTCMYTDKV